MREKLAIVAPCLTMGGMERASANLANYFAVEHFYVSYISIFKRPHFFELDQSIHIFEPPAGLNCKRLNLFQTIWWLRKTIKQLNPDTVLVFNKFYGAMVAASLIRLKTPLFVSERSSPLFKWSTEINIFNKLLFWLRPPEGIVAQTTIASDFQSKYYSRKTPIRVIPNALREVRIYPTIRRQDKILAVGRLSDTLKGFDRLLEAFAKIKNQEWHLVFAGGDEDGDHLKRQAQELGVASRVSFLGKVTDIDKVYADAGIFVIPSRSEGFPNALCEAMAAGIPSVSFDFIAGPRDIITNGHDGLIVDEGNIESLATTIDSLIENPLERKRLGDNAMGIRERFNMEKIGKEYLRFILKGGGEQIPEK